MFKNCIHGRDPNTCVSCYFGKPQNRPRKAKVDAGNTPIAAPSPAPPKTTISSGKPARKSTRRSGKNVPFAKSTTLPVGVKR